MREESSKNKARQFNAVNEVSNLYFWAKIVRDLFLHPINWGSDKNYNFFNFKMLDVGKPL